jgi:hypothetical protein
MVDTSEGSMPKSEVDWFNISATCYYQLTTPLCLHPTNRINVYDLRYK